MSCSRSLNRGGARMVWAVRRSGFGGCGYPNSAGECRTRPMEACVTGGGSRRSFGEAGSHAARLRGRSNVDRLPPQRLVVRELPGRACASRPRQAGHAGWLGRVARRLWGAPCPPFSGSKTWTRACLDPCHRGRTAARRVRVRLADFAAKNARSRCPARLRAEEAEDGQHAAMVLGGGRQSELREDARDVLLDRTRRDEEALSDRLVRPAFGHQFHHLALAW